jgi:hypothetical protein
MTENILLYQDGGHGSHPPPPPPPPPSYNSPPQMGSQGGASSNSIIALVCGILSYIFCPVVLGIVAWVMGKKELAAIDRGESPEAGRTLAKIGMWLGIVNVILSVIGIIIWVILIVIIGISASTNGYNN